MIRLLLDPPRFECETAQDAADLARLMGIKPVAAPEFTVYTPFSVETVKTKFAPRGPMRPTGALKCCKKCGGEFAIVDRTDCAAVYCKACRPVQMPRKNPKAPIPAAGRLGKAKHADPKSCTSCGASVPEFETINGECLQCAPMGARKRA